MSEEVCQLLTESVGRFVRDNYAFESRNERQSMNRFGSHWSTFSEMGWLGIPISADLEGFGLTMDEVRPCLAEMGAGLIEEPFQDGILIAASIVDRIATQKQREWIIPKVVAGDWRLCLAHKESESEFDFDSVESSVSAAGDAFIINGGKLAVPCAAWASHLLVTARWHDALELFLIPTAAEGISLNTYPCLDGKLWSDVVLNEVKVAAENRLTADCNNFEELLNRGLLTGIAASCAEASGIAKEIRSQTGDYLRAREQFGSRLADFQALQHRFADMCIMEAEIEAAARMAAAAVDEWFGHDSERRVRQAKARVGTLGRKLGEEAVQMHGGMGQTEELKIGHYLRRLLTIDAQLGSAQEHLVWIGKHAGQQYEN